jgi:hypothetical protein
MSKSKQAPRGDEAVAGRPCSRRRQRPMDGRAADAECLRDLGGAKPLRLQLTHLGRVYRRWAPLVDTGVLCLGDALELALFPAGWFRTQRTRRAYRGTLCRPRCWCRSVGRSGGKRSCINVSGRLAAPTLPQAACFTCRLAILAMVARLQPVAAWIEDQDAPAASMLAMPALHSASSGRPL